MGKSSINGPFSMAMFDTGCSPRRCLRGHRFLRQPIPAGRLREQGGRWEGLRFLEQGVRTGRDQPYCFMMVSRIRFILGLKGMTGWALTPRCWGELTSCFGDDVRAAAIDMIRPCVNSASYCTALASIHTSTIKGNLFRVFFSWLSFAPCQNILDYSSSDSFSN